MVGGPIAVAVYAIINGCNVEDCATRSTASNGCKQLLYLKKGHYNHSMNSLTKPAADTNHNDLSLVKDSGLIQRDREMQVY